MAPTKFEEQIKNKLEQRSLQPSNDSWDKLNDRLDATGSGDLKTRFWWLGIAASTILVLIVIAIVFNTRDITVAPVLVDTETPIENKVLKKEPKVTLIEQNTEAKTDLEIIANTEPTKAVKKEQHKLIPQNIDLVDSNYDKEQEIEKKSLSFKDQNIEEGFANINKIKTENNSVTENEVEALLREAQKKIELNKSKIKSDTVNANALLQEVEDDLNRSFRQRVFDALLNGYENVKTAVSERNN